MIVAKPLQDLSLATASCDTSDAVGDFVYISGNKSGSDYSVAKADPSLYAKIPAVAVITYKITPTRAVIQFKGEVKSIYTGLTAGKTYFLSDVGTPVDIPPTPAIGQKKYVQIVGVATDSTILRLLPVGTITARQG
jgi:hypothetical protein